MTHFDEAAIARRYLEDGSPYVPGYPDMLRMARQLLEERAGDKADILIVGGGGGREAAAFLARRPASTCTIVDPSRLMLDTALERARRDGFENRVMVHQGYVFDAPQHRYDAASCILTLHFVETDDEKVRTLSAIRERLRPGAPFVIAHLCIDKTAPDAERWLERYRRYALDSGEDPVDVDATCERVRTVIHMRSQSRDEDLLRLARFRDVALFFAAFAWRGWVATA